VDAQARLGERTAEEVAAIYEQAGRHAEAERLLHDTLKQHVATIPAEGRNRPFSRHESASAPLIALGSFYRRVMQTRDDWFER